jgi:hypothetical protein
MSAAAQSNTNTAASTADYGYDYYASYGPNFDPGYDLGGDPAGDASQNQYTEGSYEDINSTISRAGDIAVAALSETGRSFTPSDTPPGASVPFSQLSGLDQLNEITDYLDVGRLGSEPGPGKSSEVAGEADPYADAEYFSNSQNQVFEAPGASIQAETLTGSGDDDTLEEGGLPDYYGDGKYNVEADNLPGLTEDQKNAAAAQLADLLDEEGLPTVDAVDIHLTLGTPVDIVEAELGASLNQSRDTIADMENAMAGSQGYLAYDKDFMATYKAAVDYAKDVANGALSFYARDGGQLRGTTFFGGAGLNGAYINGIKAAMEKTGISNVRAADAEKRSQGFLADAVNVLSQRFQDSKISDVTTFGQKGEQFNLVGYSYGAVISAQIAIDYANKGGRVDNLALIGSPISQEFLSQLQSHPNIHSVHVMDLTEKGDDIKAGMSTTDLLSSVPGLAVDFAKGEILGKKEGHFYYSPDEEPLAPERHQELADKLFDLGLR